MGCGDPVNNVQLDPSAGIEEPSLERSYQNRMAYLERENERLYNSLVTLENELRHVGGDHAVTRARMNDLNYEASRAYEQIENMERELEEAKRLLRISQQTSLSLLGEKTARIIREVEERKSADGGSAEHQPERDGEDRQGSSQG